MSSKPDLEDYKTVPERISEFRAKYPDGCLRPVNPDRPYVVHEIGQHTFIVYVAAAYRDSKDELPGIGVAWEPFPGTTPYTRNSELMNAETSAWGRAIVATLAADTQRSVASREEVRNRTGSDNEASGGAGKRAPVAAAGRGLTPTQQRAERQRRTAEERAVAQAKAPGRLMDRGLLPDEDNKWQDTAPRPASPEQKNAIKARLRDTGRSAPDMSGLSYLEAARMITDLAAEQASTGQDAAPEDRPGTITSGQHKALEALLGQHYGLDSKDRDGRHQAVQQLLSLPAAPASLNDLSYRQAKTARDKIVAVMAEREREAKRAAAGPVRAGADDPWSGDAPDWTLG